MRQMRTSDAAGVFAFKSDPRVTGCYGQEPHGSITESIEWIERSLASYEGREALSWVLTLKEDGSGSGSVIGECCLWNLDPCFHYAEIGYELHPSYWQKGIMSEALRAVLSYGFADLGLHRIEANPLSPNHASRRLLLQLGFRHEGTLRQRQFFRGRFEDQECFGLLAQEWMGRPDGP